MEMNTAPRDRAKDLYTGEWRFGFFVHLTFKTSFIGRNTIYTGEAEEYGEGYCPVWHDIDKSTLGRFTGMMDKHKRPIYEGDIVRTKKYGKSVGNVNVNDYDYFQVVDTLCTFRLLRSSPERGFNLVNDGWSTIEVVGNIYDNPELLSKIGGQQGPQEEAT